MTILLCASTFGEFAKIRGAPITRDGEDISIIPNTYLGPREEEAREIRATQGDIAYLMALLNLHVLEYVKSTYPLDENAERVVVSTDPNTRAPSLLTDARKWVARNYLDLWAANRFYEDSPEAIDLGVGIGKDALIFFYQYDLHVRQLVREMVEFRSNDQTILAADLTVGEVVTYMARNLDVKAEDLGSHETTGGRVTVPDPKPSRRSAASPWIWLASGGVLVFLIFALIAAKRARGKRALRNGNRPH